MNKNDFLTLLQGIRDKSSADQTLTAEEQVILILSERWNPANPYCFMDRVRRVATITTGPMKLAAYTLADPMTLEHGKIQFHFTWDGVVLGLMSEEAAKMFSRFVNDVCSGAKRGDGSPPQSGVAPVDVEKTVAAL